ncbi:hypothetical protein OYT88_04280 [Sporolactobacillus sp. CQH2019]|uniref:hypothetical protein n=1 Tax=Sporolactobacillus sp. CQH2019 TaxID=3023512 RepID=UPI0023688EF0|nr:hypothetical protein [Sporolactobacillus sp. CQH2019]MDD9147768.1 hypothetical protein [Sporolactobacillus sp. CQH2019]
MTNKKMVHISFANEQTAIREGDKSRVSRDPNLSPAILYRLSMSIGIETPLRMSSFVQPLAQAKPSPRKGDKSLPNKLQMRCYEHLCPYKLLQCIENLRNARRFFKS